MTISVPDTVQDKLLNMQINGDFVLPIETEVDMSSKSNNLLGPGLTLGITNRNMFRRAENFSVRLTGAYEWQIGGNKKSTDNSGLINSYPDQTGDIKLEGNVEYRFKIYERFKGALFMDAGNVWLLKNETQRPGGEFRIKGLLKEIALGTGFGLRYDFSYIVIRADLGIPLHAPYSTGKSGYYNIEGSFWKGLVLNLAIGYPF